jgi:hypothetical protein
MNGDTDAALTNRRYSLELAVWLAIYAVLLVGSIAILDRNLVTWMPARAALGLSPMIAGFGILNLMMRRYREQDELQKKIMAEGIMFGFGATAILTFSYGFLQRWVGFPDLSYFYVWPVLAFSWVVGGWIARRRYS